MEGIATVRHTIHEGDWLTKLDLKDAYLTVPVFEAHLFEFVSIPFRLSSATWVFTKLLSSGSFPAKEQPSISDLR